MLNCHGLVLLFFRVFSWVLVWVGCLGYGRFCLVLPWVWFVIYLTLWFGFYYGLCSDVLVGLFYAFVLLCWAGIVRLLTGLAWMLCLFWVVYVIDVAKRLYSYLYDCCLSFSLVVLLVLVMLFLVWDIRLRYFCWGLLPLRLVCLWFCGVLKIALNLQWLSSLKLRCQVLVSSFAWIFGI